MSRSSCTPSAKNSSSVGAFVQPALFEAFGLTVIEAMSSGLPTFATCFGGPLEIIEDGSSGFHIDPNHGSQAAQRMADFFHRCREDPEEWGRISRGALARVSERYTWKGYAERLMTLSRVYGFWHYVTDLERAETRPPHRRVQLAAHRQDRAERDEKPVDDPCLLPGSRLDPPDQMFHPVRPPGNQHQSGHQRGGAGGLGTESVEDLEIRLNLGVGVVVDLDGRVDSDDRLERDRLPVLSLCGHLDELFRLYRVVDVDVDVDVGGPVTLGGQEPFEQQPEQFAQLIEGFLGNLK